LTNTGKILTVPVTLGTFGANTLVSSATPSNHLGFSVDNLTNQNIQQYKLNQDDKGVVIVEIKGGSAADKANITPGTLIMAVNHQKVTNVQEFNHALEAIEKDNKEPILFLIKQGNVIRFCTMSP